MLCYVMLCYVILYYVIDKVTDGSETTKETQNYFAGIILQLEATNRGQCTGEAG